MSNIVNRVAIAIAEECLGSTDGISGVLLLEMYVPVARKAIEAMREPTDEMVSAASDLTTQYHGRSAIWQAMIDQALAGVTGRTT